MKATPYDNELPCEQGLPGVPGVDESNVIGDKFHLHQGQMIPPFQILSFDWLGFHLQERPLVSIGQIPFHHLQIVYLRKFHLHLDEGETFDDKKFANNEEEFVQSTPEVSPEDEIPANQMRESGMEGSFVFDEGETFDDKQFANNEEEFVQSTPEVDWTNSFSSSSNCLSSKVSPSSRTNDPSIPDSLI
jgi:hypothetical protein